MSEQDRDERGQFREKMRDQDVLVVFDFETTDDDPYLTVSEVTNGLATHRDVDVTEEAVRYRLNRMTEAGVVEKRAFGPGVAYRACVAPRPARDVAARSDERRATDSDQFAPLTE